MLHVNCLTDVFRENRTSELVKALFLLSPIISVKLGRLSWRSLFLLFSIISVGTSRFFVIPVALRPSQYFSVQSLIKRLDIPGIGYFINILGPFNKKVGNP